VLLVVPLLRKSAAVLLRERLNLRRNLIGYAFSAEHLGEELPIEGEARAWIKVFELLGQFRSRHHRLQPNPDVVHMRFKD
jgi:hypothetical protein